MTDRDRLIELISQIQYMGGLESRLADHLLANGVTLGKPLVEYLHPIDAYEGLKGKYLVFKADTGEQIVNCFVLRPDKDNTAVEALRFYAYTTDNKTLAEDIYKWVGKGDTLPPCKVGDKIYRLFPKQGIVEMRVKRIQYGSYGLMICAKGDVFPASCFGETVFLAREEAERKLNDKNQ